jgi:hypothetical protein
MKQTAVEWLEEKWRNYDLNLGKSGFNLFLKQAQEMEKHQIVKAAASAYEDMFGTDGTEYGEKYYDKLTQDDK